MKKGLFDCRYLCLY